MSIFTSPLMRATSHPPKSISAGHRSASGNHQYFIATHQPYEASGPIGNSPGKFVWSPRRALGSGIWLRFLPVAHEVQCVFALVKTGEASYLPANLFQSRFQLRIGDFAVLCKNLPRFRNRRLLWND